MAYDTGHKAACAIVEPAEHQSQEESIEHLNGIHMHKAEYCRRNDYSHPGIVELTHKEALDCTTEEHLLQYGANHSYR